jgi:hypothetical protein
LNSVFRQFGICSVKRRSSSGVGFQTTDFASTGNVLGERPEALLAGVAAELELRVSVMKLSSIV